ncbi:hypothetical protein ACW2QC_11465 [Virgibacillus sp. FSP13]
MKNLIGMVLELFRIIIMLTLLGTIIWYVLIENFYDFLGNLWGFPSPRDNMIGTLGVWVFMFVLYKNHLQFSGFYKGEKRVKLPPILTKILLVVSIIMILIPPFASMYF